MNCKVRDLFFFNRTLIFVFKKGLNMLKEKPVAAGRTKIDHATVLILHSSLIEIFFSILQQILNIQTICIISELIYYCISN